jgi:hypothetical protein
MNPRVFCLCGLTALSDAIDKPQQTILFLPGHLVRGSHGRVRGLGKEKERADLNDPHHLLGPLFKCSRIFFWIIDRSR